MFRIIIQLLSGCGGWLNSCAKKQGGDQHSNVEPNGQRHGGTTQVMARELLQLVETSASKPRHFHTANLGCHFAATWVALQPRAVAEGVPLQLQLQEAAASSGGGRRSWGFAFNQVVLRLRMSHKRLHTSLCSSAEFLPLLLFFLTHFRYCQLFHGIKYLIQVP